MENLTNSLEDAESDSIVVTGNNGRSQISQQEWFSFQFQTGAAFEDPKICISFLGLRKLGFELSPSFKLKVEVS